MKYNMIKYNMNIVRCTIYFIFTVANIIAANCSFGMTFTIERDDESHINYIFGSGPITNGDAQRLREVIPRADRDQYGNIPLFLDSPGGSVLAAFEIVNVMDEEGFSTIVGSGDLCASACASIIYVSGDFHEVIGSGTLGIHSCLNVDNTDSDEDSRVCNEYISDNAVSHGTTYGIIDGYMQKRSEEAMFWIGADVACGFGLCGPPGFDDPPPKASFDCVNPKNGIDKEICNNKYLVRQEAFISQTYIEAINAARSCKHMLYAVQWFKNSQKDKLERNIIANIKHYEADWRISLQVCKNSENMRVCLANIMHDQRRRMVNVLLPCLPRIRWGKTQSMTWISAFKSCSNKLGNCR